MEEFLPCSKRLRLVAFKADGTKETIYRCSETTAPKAHSDVVAADCQECPVRSAIVRQAIKAGSYAATMFDTTGNRGKSKDTGGEGFVPCSDRLVVLMPVCCGSTVEKRVCNSPDCGSFGGEVTPVICQKCPARR